MTPELVGDASADALALPDHLHGRRFVGPPTRDLQGEGDGSEPGVPSREEGREQGRVEGMRALVAELIESRFGEVPADRRRRLEAIDSTEELMRLADRLLVARSLDDLGI